jgi:hypothetical protein
VFGLRHTSNAVRCPSAGLSEAPGVPNFADGNDMPTIALGIEPSLLTVRLCPWLFERIVCMCTDGLPMWLCRRFLSCLGHIASYTEGPGKKPLAYLLAVKIVSFFI